MALLLMVSNMLTLAFAPVAALGVKSLPGNRFPLSAFSKLLNQAPFGAGCTPHRFNSPVVGGVGQGKEGGVGQGNEGDPPSANGVHILSPL